jgi:hypothetical protein
MVVNGFRKNSRLIFFALALITNSAFAAPEDLFPAACTEGDLNRSILEDSRAPEASGSYLLSAVSSEPQLKAFGLSSQSAFLVASVGRYYARRVDYNWKELPPEFLRGQGKITAKLAEISQDIPLIFPEPQSCALYLGCILETCEGSACEPLETADSQQALTKSGIESASWARRWIRQLSKGRKKTVAEKRLLLRARELQSEIAAVNAQTPARLYRVGSCLR